MSKKISKKAKPAPKAKAKVKPKAKKAAPKKAVKVKPVVKKVKPAAKPSKVKPKAAVKAKSKPLAKKPAAQKTVLKKAEVKKPEAKKPLKAVVKAPVQSKVAANAKVQEKKPAAAGTQKPSKSTERTDITRHNMPFHKKDQIRQIIPQTKADPAKTRYSDQELEEFKKIIQKKLVDARKELTTLQAQLTAANEHGTDDTASTFKMLEDGSDSLAKEEAGQLAGRQKKFIEQLENAMIRIENKTYGVCRVTGKLIPKERLRAVPHTTQSIEAKLNQYRE